MSRLLKMFCVAVVAVFGLVAVPGTSSADVIDFDNQMWTEDDLPRGGVVYFKRAGDVVKVCDNDPNDNHATRLRVGEGPRYTIRVADGAGCLTINGEIAGGDFDLPEPGPWLFQICRMHDGNPSGCDTARWHT